MRQSAVRRRALAGKCREGSGVFGMITISGQTVHKKTVIGRLQYLSKTHPELLRTPAADVQAELAAFRKAKAEVVGRLHELYRESIAKVGELLAHTFEIHAMMVEDEAYSGMVESMIGSEKVTAAYAVAATGRHYAQMLAQMEDPYFRSRSDDITEITERLTDVLLGNTREVTLTEPVILMAEDLAPGETMQLDHSRILGIVTHLGSESSHAAILARTMNLPAVTAIAIRDEWDGHEAVLDGENGLLIVDPDEETKVAYAEKIQRKMQEEEELRALLPLPCETKSRVRIPLYANVGSVADAAAAAEKGAEGIGLLRTEFLCLAGEEYPSEEQQFETYKSVLTAIQGKPVTIRTFDLGSDKRAAYMNLPKENNPDLGFRAIRVSLAEEEPFRAQLRAILRVSAYGQVSVMYPMITAEWEIRRIQGIFREEREKLEKAGVPLGGVRCGIMIETPAAAIVCDRLMPYIDFVSIGTNDLTQYLLAADRSNPYVAPYYDPHHEAVLRTISHVVKTARGYGIDVNVCGELAADTTVTKDLVELGIDGLSVAPGAVLSVKRAVRGLD